MPEKSASLRSRTQASCYSKASRRSTIVAAAMAHPEAEVSKARLTFTKMETRMKIEKARWEALMNALIIEKENVTAIAKAEAQEN